MFLHLYFNRHLRCYNESYESFTIPTGDKPTATTDINISPFYNIYSDLFQIKERIEAKENYREKVFRGNVAMYGPGLEVEL